MAVKIHILFPTFQGPPIPHPLKWGMTPFSGAWPPLVPKKQTAYPNLLMLLPNSRVWDDRNNQRLMWGHQFVTANNQYYNQKWAFIMQLMC